MDRNTAAQLDHEIEQMTEDERNQLSRDGGRIMKRTGTDDGKAKGAAYMRKYKARIALATQRGLLTVRINSR